MGLNSFAARLAGALALPLALGGAAFAQGIVLKDMKDREVRLAGPAQRIALLPFPAPSTVIAFDRDTRRVVAMNPGAKEAMVGGIFGRIFPAVAAIPTDVVGRDFMPNIEALAALRPDVVVQWGHRGDDIVKPLTNAGLTTLLIVYGQEANLRTYMGHFGQMLGKPEPVAANIAWREKVLAELAAKVGVLPPERRPRVIHISNGLSTFAVIGRNDYSSTSIEVAGGVNAADLTMGWASPTNKEQVAVWDPDVIILNDFEDGLLPDTIYKDPILSLTKAARDKRVYKFARGGYRWEPPSHESPLGWMWLANILHPDLAPFDLRAETRAAFKAIYNFDLSDADLDGILRIAENAGAANYTQFRAK
jgi:iron complex transport system substrate-binding protein